MSRRRVIARRKIIPEPKYGDRTLAKFINVVMRSGKKSIAEKIVYGALEHIGGANVVQLETFQQAVDNVRPVVEVKSRRVGGATYQVPVEVRADRGGALAMRWIVEASKHRHGKSMAQRLADELQDASRQRGGAVRKKEDTHKMAEANKAFSHYRW